MTPVLLIQFLLALSIVLSFSEWGRKALFPFQVFTTWLHESCHALAAALLGGRSIRLTISSDGSGLTHYRIPKGRMREALIASSGYLGASAAGCLIFYFTVRGQRVGGFWNAQNLVLLLACLIAVSTLFWIRNLFGVLSALVLAGVLASFSFPPLVRFAYPVLIFLGIQTAMNALFDIRILFALGSSRGIKSDAHTLQKLLFFPYWVWAFFWMGFSIAMMIFTWHKLYG